MEARVLKRLLLQPTLHFFVLGALLFLAYHHRAADERTIVVTAGVKADLARRFQDEIGRAPTPAEAAKALSVWKREEALYREASRQGLDRDDRTIRTLLIDKLRAQAMREVSNRAPTEAELRAWLASHQALYETPLRYSLEWFALERDRPSASAERATLASKLAAKFQPSHLGAPLYGASLTSAELRERFGATVADQLPSWPLHVWRESESAQRLWLLRLNEVQGGLPPWEELRPRLEVDWTAARQRAAAERALDELAARYTSDPP
jgi:hypothetical protein